MELILTHDLDVAREIYIEIIDKTPGMDRYTLWVYGKHPSDAMLSSYIENGELYLLKDDDDVAGVVVVVMSQGKDYEAINWEQDLANDEVATIHLLGIRPSYQGKGIGRTMVKEIIKLAKKAGKKSLRLDTLKCNVPSQSLYESEGFSYRGTQNLYAPNTGWIDFLFYELSLE
jgi:ribosomal protein S18 acetylase RimI-like enzyme